MKCIVGGNGLILKSLQSLAISDALARAANLIKVKEANMSAYFHQKFSKIIDKL